MNQFRRRPARPVPALATALAAVGFTAVCAAAPAPVKVGGPSGVRVTVYQQGPALVSERRSVTVPDGGGVLRLDGLARQFVPDSLRLSAPGLDVLSQHIASGTVSAQSLRQRALGRTVRLYPRSGAARGQGVAATLVSAGEPPLVRLRGHIEAVDGASPWRIVYPADLVPRARVTARVRGKAGGPLTVSYLTGGLSWQADFDGRLVKGAKRLSVSAWASVDNGSGAGYRHARLRLVAGQVAQSPSPRPRPVMALATRSATARPAAPRALFDYYDYAVNGHFDVPDGVTVRVPLMGRRSLPVRREYRVEGGAPRPGAAGEGSPWRHARVILHLKNTANEPMPSGRWRLYGRRDGEPALLGQVRHGSIPAGAAFSLEAGRAFDVRARRVEVAYRRINGKTQQASWHVMVRNARGHAVTVRVVEPLPGAWTIETESQPHQRVDAHHVAWRVNVPAGGEARVSYRVRWQ